MDSTYSLCRRENKRLTTIRLIVEGLCLGRRFGIEKRPRSTQRSRLTAFADLEPFVLGLGLW